MMTTMTKTKTRINEQENTRVATSVTTKGGLAVMTGAAALVGLWAVACFVIAAVGNGPMAMIQGWFNAIIG